MRPVMALVASLALLSGCSSGDDEAETAKDSSAAAPASAEPTETSSETPTELPDVVMPEPSGTFTHSCDYILGDFTSYTSTGFRFVADAQLHNDGNIGTVNKVDAVWFQAGGGKVTLSKSVKVAPGKRARVGFTKPVGQDEIDLIQALGGKDCTVKVAMIDTFGEVQE